MVNMILQYIQNNLGVVIRLILLPRLSFTYSLSTKDLFTTRISERQESVFRVYGWCLTCAPFVPFGGTLLPLLWHKSALSQALFHLGETRKSASHSALLFPFYMNVCSDIKNKNAKRPNFHKGESISQSFSDEWQYKDTNKFCNSNT